MTGFFFLSFLTRLGHRPTYINRWEWHYYSYKSTLKAEIIWHWDNSSWMPKKLNKKLLKSFIYLFLGSGVMNFALSFILYIFKLSVCTEKNRLFELIIETNSACKNEIPNNWALLSHDNNIKCADNFFFKVI